MTSFASKEGEELASTDRFVEPAAIGHRRTAAAPDRDGRVKFDRDYAEESTIPRSQRSNSPPSRRLPCAARSSYRLGPSSRRVRSSSSAGESPTQVNVRRRGIAWPSTTCFFPKAEGSDQNENKAMHPTRGREPGTGRCTSSIASRRRSAALRWSPDSRLNGSKVSLPANGRPTRAFPTQRSAVRVFEDRPSVFGVNAASAPASSAAMTLDDPRRPGPRPGRRKRDQCCSNSSTFPRPS